MCRKLPPFSLGVGDVFRAAVMLFSSAVPAGRGLLIPPGGRRGGGSEGAKISEFFFLDLPNRKKTAPNLFVHTKRRSYRALWRYKWEISAACVVGIIALGMYAAKGKKEAGAISFSSGGRGRGVATTEKGDQRGGGIRRRLSPVRPLREGSGPSCFLLALLPPFLPFPKWRELLLRCSCFLKERGRGGLVSPSSPMNAVAAFTYYSHQRGIRTFEKVKRKISCFPYMYYVVRRVPSFSQ